MTRSARKMSSGSPTGGQGQWRRFWRRPPNLRAYRREDRARPIPERAAGQASREALSTPTGPTGLHPEGRRIEAPARHSGHRRSCGAGGSEDRHRTSVRGRLQRFLLWVPASQERPSRPAGNLQVDQLRLRPRRRCGPQVVLRHDSARQTAAVRAVAGHRPVGCKADRPVAHGRGHGGHARSGRKRPERRRAG